MPLDADDLFHEPPPTLTERELVGDELRKSVHACRHAARVMRSMKAHDLAAMFEDKEQLASDRLAALYGEI